jgi:hypothetical protein
MRPVRNPNYVTFGAKESIVTFASARGELRTNDSGEFFLRSMAGGRFTCASPDLERKLIDAGVRAGVPVGITRNTYNRAALWKVRVIGQVTEMPAREASANTTSEGKSNGLPERVYAKVEPPALPLSTPESLFPATSTRDLSAGVPALVFPECDAVAALPLIAAPSASSAPADGGLLGRCLCEALDACKAAQAHAAAIGLPTVFGAGEVERLGVSIFIERTRYGSVAERMPNGRASGSIQHGASA